jgi:hypothetical protein
MKKLFLLLIIAVTVISCEEFFLSDAPDGLIPLEPTYMTINQIFNHEADTIFAAVTKSNLPGYQPYYYQDNSDDYQDLVQRYYENPDAYFIQPLVLSGVARRDIITDASIQIVNSTTGATAFFAYVDSLQYYISIVGSDFAKQGDDIVLLASHESLGQGESAIKVLDFDDPTISDLKILTYPDPDPFYDGTITDLSMIVGNLNEKTKGLEVRAQIIDSLYSEDDSIVTCYDTPLFDNRNRYVGDTTICDTEIPNTVTFISAYSNLVEIEGETSKLISLSGYSYYWQPPNERIGTAQDSGYLITTITLLDTNTFDLEYFKWNAPFSGDPFLEPFPIPNSFDGDVKGTFGSFVEYRDTIRISLEGLTIFDDPYRHYR